MYGGKCRCCGKTDLRFLTFEHKEGGGCRYRTGFGKGSRTMFLAWLLEKVRKEIEVLCYDCNCAKNANGRVCPHEADARETASKNHIGLGKGR